jgi:hypothetical protein
LNGIIICSIHGYSSTIHEFLKLFKNKNKKFDVDVYNTIAHFELFVKSNGAVKHMKRNKNKFHSLPSFIFVVLEKKKKTN